MLEANAMDFDDLLVRTVNALELFEEVRERWRRTFRHVLVDEYQDTNHAQYRLLQLLAAEHGNLMVVGDEDQSIYGFRHADIRNILDFEKDFPEARGGQARAELPLDPDDPLRRQRRRSNATASGGRRSSGPKIEGGEPVQLSELADEHEEARWVAGEIERLAEEHGVSRSDVAVFYRTNAMSRVLEDTLQPLRGPLPGDRRHQVLRTGRDQGRGRLPQPAASTRPTRSPSRASSTRRGAGSATPPRAGSPPTPTPPG